MKHSGFRLFLFFVLFFPLIFAGLFLLYLELNAYGPPPVESVGTEARGTPRPFHQRAFTLLTWNIGYAGLGKEMDFFYEGGSRVRPDEEEFGKYLQGIARQLVATDSLDFILIQEVDRHAKRSWFTDEINRISSALPGYSVAFAKNYDCRYVPLPIRDPMGVVVSGIATYSKTFPAEADRIAFDSRFSWPKQLVMLKRCLLLTRFPLVNGHDLVVINTHNSAYDVDGSMRRIELKKLMEVAGSEYRKGNFVVIGGDWNSNPRGFCKDSIHGEKTREIDPQLPDDFLPEWQFAYDRRQPTNRDVDGPYRRGVTATTIIDFFVLSPNIELITVHTLPLAFADADHQPVVMKVRL